MKSLKWLLSLSVLLLFVKQSSSYDVTFRAIYDPNVGVKYINTSVSVLEEDWQTAGDLLTYPTVGPSAWTANWVSPGGWILYKPDGTWETGQGVDPPNPKCVNAKYPHIRRIIAGTWKVLRGGQWVDLQACMTLQDGEKVSYTAEQKNGKWMVGWERDNPDKHQRVSKAVIQFDEEFSGTLIYRDPMDWDIIDLSELLDTGWELVASSDSDYFATYLLPNSQAGCIPEPVTLILFGVGLLPVLRHVRKRN